MQLSEILEYTSCDGTLTATATINLETSTFYADEMFITFTDADALQFTTITWNYPEITLATLSASETVTVVLEFHLYPFDIRPKVSQMEVGIFPRYFGH